MRIEYQLFQALRPSKVPEQYRLKRAPASGTPAFRRARRNLHKLNNKTRDGLRPYFLSSRNPESYWYEIVRQPLTAKTSRSFTLVPAAHAGEDLLREVYITDTGFKVVILGPTQNAALVQMARQLVEEKKMYENFQKLMGRTTPHPGDHELWIYIVHSIESTKDREEAQKKGEVDPEPYGLCTDIAYDPNNPDSKDESIPTGIPEIFISAGENVVKDAEETRRRLGATLAHEMFHAFQCAFDRDTEPWVEEATAVWAENFIDRSWNTEQVFIKSAFNSALHGLKDLESNDDETPYGMYLFPLFLTENRPGEDGIIRRIWEAIAGGREPVKAVKSSLRGDFEEIWKEYALATMDEDPESGKFPDNPNRWGQGPLILNTIHNYFEFKVESSGADLGGTMVFLDKLSASYLKAINEHEGPDAPAIRFDLTDFKKDDKVSVQAVIVYRDGRREYEDWTNRNKRVFCLSIPRQNFSEIYIVVANSAEEQDEQDEFWLNIYPESEEDCFKGSATMTLKIYGSENRDIKKRYGRKIEQGSSSWSETVAVRMDLKPWREDIPPRLQSMLELMDSIYPEADKDHIAEARKDVEGAVRAPVQYKDSVTGSLVLKYRVTSVSITSGSGRKRLSSLNETRDSLGLTSSCRVSYSETKQQKGLDESTKEWLKERRSKVEIFLHPDTK
ncbi:MAG: hypothetical protein GQ559_02120 [Desulfobulbaceae bacterium]|nr:hypothetical protein [Desulfobulbaceae bacterium]